MINKEKLYKDVKERAKFIYQEYQHPIFRENGKEISNYTLEFNLKEDLSIGGKAWSKNNLDNIQINKGVIDNYFIYFHSFRTGQTEKFLEKISNETNFETSYEFIKFNENGEVKHFDSKVIDTKLASLLTIFVSRFIITHELGHLLLGHCEYLNSKEQDENQYIPMFEKNNNENTKNVSALDFRTLEMDADAFATTDNFRNLLILYKKFNEKVDSDLNIEPKELFYWWSFAIRSNFLITEYMETGKKYRPEAKHLPSVARWILILGSIEKNINYSNINFRNGDTKSEIFKQILMGFQFAEKEYSKHASEVFDCLKETDGDADFVKYVTDIENNWENLRNELNRFSRVLLYKSNNT